MATVRSFDPTQIKAIRQAVQEQMRRIVTPKAVPTEAQPVGQIPNQGIQTNNQ